MRKARTRSGHHHGLALRVRAGLSLHMWTVAGAARITKSESKNCGGVVLINLKSAFLLRGVRQYHVARMVGISEEFLSMVIASRRVASPELKKNIATALDLDQQWLFTETPGVPGYERRVKAHADRATA